ncbi:MAG TPA: hypothetical protein VK975_01625 [Acidimicrobiales bacterium]|nr:hypothetical protein [Acidimicrobiales bacterium]
MVTAKHNLEKTRLRAPADGVVVSVSKHVGELSQGGGGGGGGKGGTGGAGGDATGFITMITFEDARPSGRLAATARPLDGGRNRWSMLAQRPPFSRRRATAPLAALHDGPPAATSLSFPRCDSKPFEQALDDFDRFPPGGGGVGGVDHEHARFSQRAGEDGRQRTQRLRLDEPVVEGSTQNALRITVPYWLSTSCHASQLRTARASSSTMRWTPASV